MLARFAAAAMATDGEARGWITAWMAIDI